jgi:hypothetical protein
MPVKSLSSIFKHLFGGKGVVQAICSQFSKKLLVVANNLSSILLPQLKTWSDISQAIILQNCMQIANILSQHFLHK